MLYMSLFSLLDSGEIVVAHDSGNLQIATWNTANTFIIWQYESKDHDFVKVNEHIYKGIKTLDFKMAQDYAERWFRENREAALGNDDDE